MHVEKDVQVIEGDGDHGTILLFTFCSSSFSEVSYQIQSLITLHMRYQLSAKGWRSIMHLRMKTFPRA
ncbi:hypothetical protein K1719_027414 [Acacia pycnantha]|nr:hypothetical protein K1719_027414 [Acacia pycnantha]